MNRRSLIASTASLPILSMTQVATPPSTPSATPVGSAEYRREAFDLQSLRESELSFTEDELQEIAAGGYFEDDIKRYKRGGVVNDHPLTVSQYVLRLLNNYRLTGGEVYLQHAEMNLDHITESEVIFDDRGLYPYDFDYRLTSEPGGILTAPWVSGMTQGTVLQVYNRYFRMTGSNRYKVEAERALASFRVINDTSALWSPTANEDGYLWLEEYPGDPPTETLNGHIYAIFGLYEQWLMTPESWLLNLIRGAITTVRDLALSYRREGRPSRYWAISEKYADRYHVVHIAQMLELYSMTGDVKFAQIADKFWSDYPPYKFSGLFYLEPGTYEAAHYDSDAPSIIFGKKEELTIESRTPVRTSQRRRMPESDDYWYLCTSAPFARMWIKEDSSLGVQEFGEYVGPKSLSGPLYGTRMMYSPIRTGRTIATVSEVFNVAGQDAIFPSQRANIAAGSTLSVMARELISGDDYALVEIDEQRIWVRTELIEFDV